MANANLNLGPRHADTKNPDRGPLLIIEGERTTVPWACECRVQAAEAQSGRHRDRKIPNRGHAPTIDRGWREV